MPSARLTITAALAGALLAVPAVAPAHSHYVGGNLAGHSCRGENLDHEDFSRANLRNADFRGADLRMADFTKATLVGADCPSGQSESPDQALAPPASIPAEMSVIS